MKKAFKWSLFILFVVALPLCIASCGDDKDEPDKSDYSSLIIGKWSDNGNSNWYEDENGHAYGFEFKENGVCYKHGSAYGPGRYQIFDNVLIISFNDHNWDGIITEHFIVTKLTKDVLVLQDSEYYDEETYYRVK